MLPCNISLVTAARVQVRGHAVEVLQRTQDEELLYYLLQLVQALRYEATTHSRLSAFLVSRAAKNTVMGTLLHWQASLASLPLDAACPIMLLLHVPSCTHVDHSNKTDLRSAEQL